MLKEKRVHFSGLDKPFPYPVAIPPGAPPSPALRQFATKRPGIMCNEMSSVVRLGGRKRRSGLLNPKLEKRRVDAEDGRTAEEGECKTRARVIGVIR